MESYVDKLEELHKITHISISIILLIVLIIATVLKVALIIKTMEH